MPSQDKTDLIRIIAKELRWLSRNFYHLYELEMRERNQAPQPDDEDPNQLSLFEE